MTKTDRFNLFIKHAKEVHGDRYDYSRVVYTNNDTPVEIICPTHGSFWQKPRAHTSNKSGCLACGGKMRLTTEEFIERAIRVHGDKYSYDGLVYENARSHVAVTCPNHGEFLVAPINHLGGKGCAKCYNEWRKEHWSNLNEQERKQHGEKISQAYQNISDDMKKQMLKNKSIARKKWWRELADEEKAEYGKKIQKGQQNPADGVPFSKKMKLVWQSKSDDDLKKIIDKTIESKRRRCSFSTSSPQNKVKSVLYDVFGIDDVLCEYKDSDRYPFLCDFYIKSLDLFIELNAHWSHGFHWFDENDSKDIEKLNMWREKSLNSKFYEEAIVTWTVRDVAKKRCAQNNGLNYLVFWKNDLSDFYEWLSSIGKGEYVTK